MEFTVKIILENVIWLANFIRQFKFQMEEKFIRDIFFWRLLPWVLRRIKTRCKKEIQLDIRANSYDWQGSWKQFKHITGSTGLFEVRVEVGSEIYRVFSFFDKEKLIIHVNGFKKKTQKKTKEEIEFAEKLKKQYFDGKDNK